MDEPPSRTLYVFLDESGDMTFKAKGTDHFVLSAVYTDSPCESAAAMQNLKYDLLAGGSTDLEFHATHNSLGTRKRVRDCIAGIGSIKAHTVWIDKGFTHPSMQSNADLFSLFGGAMAKFVGKVLAGGYDQIVMYFDSCLTKKEQAAFLAKVIPALKALNVKFRILFQPVKQDLNGQIADYFSWAWFRYKEHGDDEMFEALRADIQWSQFNLFRHGHTRYWVRK